VTIIQSRLIKRPVRCKSRDALFSRTIEGKPILSIEDFLGSPFFRYGVFPLASAASGILLKAATRNDKYALFKKEDMAVGPQLMLTAALTYVVLTIDRARALVEVNRKLAAELKQQALDAAIHSQLQQTSQALSGQIMSAAWMVIILIFGLWGTTTVVKRWGWRTDAEMTPYVGITGPLILGVLVLMFVMAAATQ
jgi:hypothetical protein